MNQSHIEQAPHKGRHVLFSTHFLIPVAIMIGATILFGLLPLDHSIQSHYYRDGWHLADIPLARILYHYGNLPALCVALFALYQLFRSFGKSILHQRYRKLSLYLVLALVIGPGLIVNSILKDHWGRPRPRDVVEYGGRYSYEAPLTMDRDSPGKSFPCGHATMGFYFYALAFALGIRRKPYYYLLLAFATIYGVLIGWVRIVQGGHFASDVVFAGAIVYLSSWLLFKAMKLDTNPYYQSKSQPRKLALWHKSGIATAGILIILAVSLATPYSTTQNLGTTIEGDYHLLIDLDAATVNLSFGDSLYVGNTVQGFGFPGSKARITRYSDGDTLSFVQKKKGLFTEFNADLKVVIDTLRTKSLSLVAEQGELTLSRADAGHESLALGTEASMQQSGDSTAKYRITVPKIRIKEEK